MVAMLSVFERNLLEVLLLLLLRLLLLLVIQSVL